MAAPVEADLAVTSGPEALARPAEGIVVPVAKSGEVTDTSLEQYRESVLTSRFWNTGLGKGLLAWFWGMWLGRWLTRKFGPDATPPGEPQELHGYAYWLPVAFVITCVEIAGATSSTFIHWPTISSTVGHIQDLDGRWGLAVVFIIGATALAAVTSTQEADPPGTKRILGLRYGWPLVLLIVAVTALLVALLDDTDNRSLKKYHLGYAIYGTFAVFGIIIPMILVWANSNHVVFPSLFYTLRKLRTRFRWLAVAIIGGLAILLVHLALYPWPNLAREPAKFAGINGYHARAAAETAIKNDDTVKDGLGYSAEIRTITHGQDLWLVVFLVNNQPTDTPCVVEVSTEKNSSGKSHLKTVLRPDCKK